MKRFCIVVLVIFSCIFSDMLAEGAVLSPEEQRYIQMLTSPAVSNLFDAHFADVSLYTGKMNLSVPLYQLKDPDFPLSVSLEYNAEAFKPRKHSGIVGYNWVLNVGGCITREVNTYPDEVLFTGNNYLQNYKGILEFFRSEVPNPDSVFSLSPTVLDASDKSFTRTGNNSNIIYDIDYQPDIYHFDFCGHHGSFMINNYGNPTIINGDFVNVDLSQSYQDVTENSEVYSYQQVNYPAIISKIIIHTLDGYTYEFGGDPSSVGCSVSIGSGNAPFKSKTPIFHSWFLKKITAPNGRTVTFYYKPQSNSLLGLDNNLWLYNEEYIKETEANSDIGQAYNNMREKVGNAGMGIVCQKSVTKECVLESISVSGPHPLTITFSNGLENNSMYPINHYHINSALQVSSHNYQLNSMSVVSMGETLKNVSFTYETKANNDGNYHWRFLKKISVCGQGSYNLEYNHSTYPDPSSSYNGYYLCYDLDGYWMASNYSGLLTKITFPTGGYQQYNYEKHQTEFKRNYIPETNAQGQYTGRLLSQKSQYPNSHNGVRIEQITTFDFNGSLLEKKNYLYSNGVYFDNKMVKLGYHYFLIDDLSAYNINSSPIGYPQVEERVSSKENILLEHNIYYFATDENLTSSPLLLNIATDAFSSSSFSWPTYYSLASRFLMFGDRLLSFGKLVGKDVYISNSNLSQKEFYYYNNTVNSTSLLHPQPLVPQYSGDTITLFSYMDSVPMSRRLYTYPDVFNQKTTFDYNGDNILSTTSAYYYDRKQRVKKSVTFGSDSKEYFTYNSYPDEYLPYPFISDNAGKAIFLLVRKNQIMCPVETYSGYKSQNTEFVTSGSMIKYYTDLPTLHLGDPIPTWSDYIVYPSQFYSLALSAPISNFFPLSMYYGHFYPDSRYKLEKECQYDNLLRPISVTSVGNPTVTYTWDGYYPSIVTVGTHTTTYTSTPHVGITSITDPKGLTTYYSYDAYGRLVEVYRLVNNVKQIIQAYDYHITSEQQN